MDSKKFMLKKEHIMLAEALNFTIATNNKYNNKYVPGISMTRPFGNSHVLYNVMDRLGMLNEKGEYSQEDAEIAEMLLIELPVALEIILQQKTFKPGMYEVSPCGAYLEYETALSYKMLEPLLEIVQKEIRTNPLFKHNKDHMLHIVKYIALNIRNLNNPYKDFTKAVETLSELGEDKEQIERLIIVCGSYL